MSMFFKPRNPGDVQQTSAAPSTEAGAPEGHPGEEAGLLPPFVRPGAAAAGVAPPVGTAPGMMPPVAAASGVVPPLAAPVYSMAPAVPVPPPPPADESVVIEAVTAPPETQRRVEQQVQVALQRASAAGSPAPVVRSRPAPPRAPAPRSAPRRPRQAFDPQAYAQAGMVNLAWAWSQSGSPIRAIHTYMQVLSRYPGTPAADAAVADLVAIADLLAEQGQFHTALSIYDKMDELV